MKHIVLTSLVMLVITATSSPAQSIAHASADATPLRLEVRADSRLWLEGSSNVRDWRCDATSLDASIDLDASAERSGDTRVRRVQVRVPTYSLTCGRSQMDRIMYKALHVDDEPDCRQIVGRFDVIADDEMRQSLVMQGTLRVAGVERIVRVPVQLEQMRDGTIRARGALPILMTDYGISPPTALFGVLRTENRIIVKFDLLVDRPTTIASVAGGER
jgi:polyisoprenoid-binding protein YceI